MGDADVQKEMGKKLVSAMDAEKAKGVLIKVIEGDDLYMAILTEGGGAPAAKKPIKRRARSDKGTTRATARPDPPMPAPASDRPPPPKYSGTGMIK